MGFFIESAELKRLTNDVNVQTMDKDVLEELYIWPAERRIEEAFNLNLDTNYDPSHLVARFTQRPVLRTQFQTDMKRAVLHLVTYWMSNVNHLRQEGIGGANAVYGPRMPPAVSALMRRWMKFPRVTRI